MDPVVAFVAFGLLALLGVALLILLAAGELRRTRMLAARETYRHAHRLATERAAEARRERELRALHAPLVLVTADGLSPSAPPAAPRDRISRSTSEAEPLLEEVQRWADQEPEVVGDVLRNLIRSSRPPGS